MPRGLDTGRERKRAQAHVSLLCVPPDPAVLGKVTILMLDDGGFAPPGDVVGDPDYLIALDTERPCKAVGVTAEGAAQFLPRPVLDFDTAGLDHGGEVLPTRHRPRVAEVVCRLLPRLQWRRCKAATGQECQDNNNRQETGPSAKKLQKGFGAGCQFFFVSGHGLTPAAAIPACRTTRRCHRGCCGHRPGRGPPPS